MSDENMLNLLDRCADTAYNVGSVTLSKDDMMAIYYFVDRQKAEVERLQRLGALATRKMVNARAKAIKEFAERLKAKASDFEFGKAVWVVYIDNLVKEMVGDGK